MVVVVMAITVFITLFSSYLFDDFALVSSQTRLCLLRFLSICVFLGLLSFFCSVGERPLSQILIGSTQILSTLIPPPASAVAQSASYRYNQEHLTVGP